MMARREIFGFRLNQEERRMIEALAARLQRTQSDVIRLIVREAAGALLPTGQKCTAQEARHDEK